MNRSDEDLCLLLSLLEKAEKILSLINLSDTAISKYNQLKQMTFEKLNISFTPLIKRATTIQMDNQISNQDNLLYFDFYTMPNYEPYMTQEEMDKYIKITGHAPTDVITKKEADISIDFHKTCSMFCIVNPKTNHVISFYGVGEDKAAKLQNLLNYLKTYDW